MNLSLIPGRPVLNGQALSYSVELPSDERAELTMVAAGWELVIKARNGRVTRRGLFGSTHDALMVLEAEYYPHPFD